MQFKDYIKQQLDARAAEDPQFALKYANEKKSLDECVRFIIGEILHKYVKSRKGVQVAMPERAECVGLAVHYYDEDNIKLRPLSGVGGVSVAGNVRSTSNSRAKAKDKENVKLVAKVAGNEKKREKKPVVEDMFFGSLFDASMFE